MEEGHYLKKVRLLQTEEGDSDVTQSEGMMNIIGLWKPNSANVSRKMKWSVVSNTAERPKQMRTKMMSLSFANRLFLKPIISAASAECWDQGLDAVGLEVKVIRRSIINSEYIFSQTIEYILEWEDTIFHFHQPTGNWPFCPEVIAMLRLSCGKNH